jgi:hypothetical protein
MSTNVLSVFSYRGILFFSKSNEEGAEKGELTAPHLICLPLIIISLFFSFLK